MGMELVMAQEMRAVDAEMARMRMQRRTLACSVGILCCYQQDCEEALAWQERNNVQAEDLFPLPLFIFPTDPYQAQSLVPIKFLNFLV